MEQFNVIVFESTHDAIKTERALKQDLKIELIPTPREITASCGLSVKFSLDDYDAVKEIIRELGAERKRVYQFTKTEDGSKSVWELDWGL